MVVLERKDVRPVLVETKAASGEAASKQKRVDLEQQPTREVGAVQTGAPSAQGELAPSEITSENKHGSYSRGSQLGHR